ncbi:MAG: hypothetical protein PHS44_06970 [Candidatus Dojkabacteria bacterium]|jgi:hypothetical protein|nr:hypothetical protein [Candidatus Dojkabacteria bacterium]
MHPKQKEILAKLKLVNGQRYSELYRGFDYEDKFPYHIKYLLQKGFINKRDRKYYLTRKGALKGSYFDDMTLNDRQHKIPIMLFVCKFKSLYYIWPKFKNDLNRRTVHTIPGAKAVFGERLADRAGDMLKVKYGVEGRLKFRAIHEYTERTTDGKILFDDIFLVYDCLVENIQSNVNWFKKAEVARLDNLWVIARRYILEDVQGSFHTDEVYENYYIHAEDLECTASDDSLG